MQTPYWLHEESMTMKLIGYLLLAAATLCILPVLAIAQPGNGAPAGGSDAALAGGVYVPDSGVAGDRIRDAERLARAGEWDTAAQIMHEIYAKSGNKLLRVAGDSGLYMSVGEYVNRMLASWPEEGLSAYRARYDGIAKQAYEQALSSGDAGAMAEVVQQYWASSIGPEAANMAAELALESGRFSSAIDLWSRLLTYASRNAKLSGRVPTILAKLAVAYTWNNQPEEAKRMRDRLAAEFADETASFTYGQTLLKWAQSFDKSLLPDNTRVGGIGDHPIIGGGPDRNTIPPSKLSFGARIWVFDEHKTAPQPTPNPGMYGGAAPMVKSGRQARGTSVLYPVLANGVLYLTSPAGVFALSAASGKPCLWRNLEIRSTIGPNNMGYPYAQTLLFSPTYADGRLYVDYGVTVARQIYGGDQGIGGGGVACLDAGTGKLLWKLDLDTITNLKRGVVDSSPVVYGGRVFLVVHVPKSVFDDVFLLAADARTGKLIWQQPISSADGGSGYMYVRAPTALAAADGNTIYLATNMGTVAAVMAENGQVRWIRQYERIDRTGNDPNFMYRPPPPPTDEFSPTIVWNGQVIVAPSDSADLLVLDAATGRITKRINKKRDLFDLTEVYGVIDGKIIGRGTQVVAWDLDRHRLDWSITPDSEPTYRGQLTQQYLYLPTEKYLLRMDLADRGRTEPFPWQPGDKVKDCDGTILLSNRMIITVNSERISGYCEWEKAEQTDKEDIAKASKETRPDRILDYAGHAYMTRRLALAKEQLSRAVAEVGGFDNLTRPDLKLRVFVNAMEFATETWKQDPKATLELLQMASMCPPDVEGHVRYRMALARYWEDNGDLPQSVRYFQEVLSDPTMRAANYRIDDQNRHEAGRFARDNIDRLVAARGADVYKAVAEKAESEYTQAHAVNNWTEVERLLGKYPNSVRTREEVFGLAEHLASAKDFDGAINWLRYFRREYPVVLEHAPDQDARSLTRMANYALQLRRKWLDNKEEPEKTRLSRAHRALLQAFSYVNTGRKLGEKITVNIDNVDASFPAHRARMQQEHGKQLQMLPQVSSGLKNTRTLTMPQNSRLLRPQIGSGPATNDDIVLVSVMNGATWDLRGYRPGKSAEPLWTRKYDQERGQATNLVTYCDDNAVIVQLNRLKAINPETGDIIWTAELKNEQPQMGGLRFFSRFENTLLAAGAMNAMAVDLETGKVVSQFALPDMINSQVEMTDQLFSYVARNNQQKVLAVDWRTGKVVTKADLVSPQTFWSVIAADNRVIVSGGQGILAANDVETGKLLWKLDTPNQIFNQVNSVEVRGRIVYTAERNVNRWQIVARDVLANGKAVWTRQLPEARQMTGQPMKLMLQDDELIAWVDNVVAVLDAEKGDVSYMPFLGPNDFVRDLLVTQDYLVVVAGPSPNIPFRGPRRPAAADGGPPLRPNARRRRPREQGRRGIGDVWPADHGACQPRPGRAEPEHAEDLRADAAGDFDQSPNRPGASSNAGAGPRSGERPQRRGEQLVLRDR